MSRSCIIQGAKEVIAYQCDTCRTVLSQWPRESISDFEERVAKHASTPKDTPLPKGLVYTDSPTSANTQTIRLVYGSGEISNGVDNLNGRTHTNNHSRKTFYQESGILSLDGTQSFDIGKVNSAHIKSLLQKQLAFLLTEEAFLTFQENYRSLAETNRTANISPDELVRTTQELEALLQA